MNQKKTLATICAVLAVGSSFALPVSAQQPLPDQTIAVCANENTVQPYWSIANYARLSLQCSGGTATAKIVCQFPSNATARYSTKIYSKAPGGSWTQAASSSTPSASCSTKSGYQYKAEATLTLTLNGEIDIIDLSDGPYTA